MAVLPMGLVTIAGERIYHAEGLPLPPAGVNHQYLGNHRLTPEMRAYRKLLAESAWAAWLTCAERHLGRVSQAVDGKEPPPEMTAAQQAQAEANDARHHPQRQGGRT